MESKLIKNTKQVIVMRKFSGLRTGKYISQAAHASMSFLTKNMYENYLASQNMLNVSKTTEYHSEQSKDHVDEITHWLDNSFRKICVFVNSEEELDAIHQKAIDNGLISHMIIDNGATEFNGVLTKTVVAIGPAYDNKFIGLTDKLPLL